MELNHRKKEKINKNDRATVPWRNFALQIIYFKGIHQLKMFQGIYKLYVFIVFYLFFPLTEREEKTAKYFLPFQNVCYKYRVTGQDKWSNRVHTYKYIYLHFP